MLNKKKCNFQIQVQFAFFRQTSLRATDMVPLVLLVFCNREGENQPPIKRSICICSLKPPPGITLLVTPGPAGNVLASQHLRAAWLGSATPGLGLDEVPAATGAQPVLTAP